MTNATHNAAVPAALIGEEDLALYADMTARGVGGVLAGLYDEVAEEKTIGHSMDGGDDMVTHLARLGWVADRLRWLSDREERAWSALARATADDDSLEAGS
ncbi:MAG: hypothetical protein KG028_00030 [Actinobacteria bacterium]|nr:hypothetical protein [Actinomycetota bacterium]